MKLREFQNDSQINSAAKVLLITIIAICIPNVCDERYK